MWGQHNVYINFNFALAHEKIKKKQPQIQNTLVKLQKLSVLAKQGNHLRDIKNTI